MDVSTMFPRKINDCVRKVSRTEPDKLHRLQANSQQLSSSFDQAFKVNCQSGVHCFALIFIFAQHNMVVKPIKRPVIREFNHDF